MLDTGENKFWKLVIRVAKKSRSDYWSPSQWRDLFMCVFVPGAYEDDNARDISGKYFF